MAVFYTSEKPGGLSRASMLGTLTCRQWKEGSGPKLKTAAGTVAAVWSVPQPVLKREYLPTDLGFPVYRELPRKEVIQPHLPVQLPCYDFVPVTNPTLGRCLPCGLAHGLQVLSASMT